MDAAIQLLGLLYLRESEQSFSTTLSPVTTSDSPYYSIMETAFEPVLLERKAAKIKAKMGIPLDDTSRVRTKFQGAERQLSLLSYIFLPNLACFAFLCSKLEHCYPFTSTRLLPTDADISFRWKSIFAKAMIRPFAIFFNEPIIQLLGLYMAFMCVSSLFWALKPPNVQL